jgi:ElaB/YqjD/DUF883 family membrane-anchored ribosome-binding protein
MVGPVQDVRREASSSPSTDDWTLEEMRERVALIADDLKKVVAARSDAAKDTAQDGAKALRKGIRQQPALAMGLATAAGALLAVIAVPRFGRRARPARWEAWMPATPSITRADLYDFANNMRHSAMRAANSAPLTSSLERLVDAVSKIEPSASLTTAIEKAGGWIQKLRSGAKD